MNRPEVQSRRWHIPGFVLGMLFGIAIAYIAGAIDSYLEFRGRFVVPEGPTVGLEGVRLLATRPDDAVDVASGGVRWEVAATAAGPVVTATATVVDRGIAITLTMSRSAATGVDAILLDVAAEVPRAYGDVVSTSIASGGRDATKALSIVGAAWSSPETGVAVPAAAAKNAFAAEVVTVSIAMRAAPDSRPRDILVGMAIGESGRAALATAFGW